MFFNVVKAEYIKDFIIDLVFKNGKAGTVDLSGYIREGDIYKPINSPQEFSRFKVELGAIVWNDGDIDIAPETLYEKATGEKIVLTQEKAVKGA